MAKRLTRQEMYDLAWSQSMRTLAQTFGISDVGLAKHFHQMHVPVPPRGYWARETAGKATTRIPLPPRPVGLDDHHWFGRSRYEHLLPVAFRRRNPWSTATGADLRRDTGGRPRPIEYYDRQGNCLEVFGRPKPRHCHLRGRALRGERCRAAVPHGHWITTSFTGALRVDGMTAPRCSMGR
jgi:hypothetical protein